MIINTSRVIQHKRKSAITKIKSLTAPKASGSLSVQVSAINYFHVRRRPASERTLSVLQDMTPVVQTIRSFTSLASWPSAWRAQEEPHQSLLRPARQLRQAAPSARRLHPARRYSVQARRERGRAKPDRSWVSPTSASPRGFCSRRGERGRYSALVRNHSPRRGFTQPMREEATTTPPTSPAGDAGIRVGWLRGSGRSLS
jgi:hypothetical protein